MSSTGNSRRRRTWWNGSRYQQRIAELLQLCLKSTYLSYNGEFYEQRQGTAMGSSISAVVANMYIGVL